jgi:TPR repeat protein
MTWACQYSLGQMYAEGRGVRKELVEAHMWLSLSASAGFDTAHRALVALEYQLTADQIGLAEAMASEWLAARASEEAEDEEGSPEVDPRRQSFPVR